MTVPSDCYVKVKICALVHGEKGANLRRVPNSFISLVEKNRGLLNESMNGTCHSLKPHRGTHCPVVDCFYCFSVFRFSPTQLLFRNKFIEKQS